ncbi:serine/threonine protein kinase [Acidobacteriota bacterium]
MNMESSENSGSGSRTGLSIGSSKFDEEVRSFVQQRLRIFTTTISSFFILMSFIFIIILSRDPELNIFSAVGRYCTRAPNSILFFLTLTSSVISGFLWRKRIPWNMMRALDAAYLQTLLLPCLYLYLRYHNFSFSGFPVVVPFMMLFILARSIFIPSRAQWTVALSAPAAVGVLIIQLVKGNSFAFSGQAFDSPHFVDMIFQNQVLLIGSIVVAAIASRVHLGLRMEYFQVRQFGQYKIERLLGKGGMGEVYLATHSLLKRPTAVKFLRPEITGVKTLNRFEKEVRLSSQLSHPNSISIYDYGHTAEGFFYYAMEFLHGANLRQIVRETGPMPASRAIHVLVAACGALKEAHDKGIIHRDIKPENIMVCELGGEKDVVKILDFGLVKDLKDPASMEFEEEGSISGTPETIAPEALGKGSVGPLSDLYSLCAVGCFLLTGKPIFNAKSVTDFLKSHLYSVPIPPSKRNDQVPEDIEKVLLKGLRKTPKSRHKGVDEMRTALLECADAGLWGRDEAEEWWTENSEILSIEKETAMEQFTQTLHEGATVTMSLPVMRGK